MNSLPRVVGVVNSCILLFRDYEVTFASDVISDLIMLSMFLFMYYNVNYKRF